MRYRITRQKEKYSSEQTISIETSQRTAIEKYTSLAKENYFCLLEMGTPSACGLQTTAQTVRCNQNTQR